ncbi:uncharacterized protein LOC135817118 [Sycon ciliatum]|uniref:uncharacterized protein LOC135817118 n=1 Tax=Sycon ciliatum TaxID=27933 RepID=UPI0031F662A5
MLARLASRTVKVAARSPAAAISARHDSHYNPSVVNSQSLTQEQVIAQLDSDIKKREDERFRWLRMGLPWTQTYVIVDSGFEYCRGGIPGWAWMLAGTVTLGLTSYKFFTERFHDPYVHQHNPKPDLEEYHRIKSRLANEPDFWNWDERDAAKEAAAE